MVRLFVYGTLKRGGSNAAELRGADFEGEAVTAPGYVLHLVDGYPALTGTEQPARVRGELYAVSSEHLARLDEFEGCPALYRREEILLADGRRAMAYVMDRSRVAAFPRLGSEEFREDPGAALSAYREG